MLKASWLDKCPGRNENGDHYLALKNLIGQELLWHKREVKCIANATAVADVWTFLGRMCRNHTNARLHSGQKSAIPY